MLLSGGHVLSLNPVGFARRDLRIEGASVTGTGRRLTARPDEAVYDCSGKFIVAGQVNAHTHLYSSLARGMAAPRRAPTSFPDMLARVWWRLDRALDAESIYDSALAGALDAVRSGTTTIVDHHASPNAIPGSLDIIRDACRTVGVRAVLCYEVTDRGGARRREAGLAENDRFLASTGRDPMYRGLVGAHASFTLGDAALDGLAAIARAHRSGVHVHVAEARDDEERTRSEYGCGILDRFEAAGLLTERAVLVHGVHLDAGDRARVRRAGAWLAHNPRSNMNNAVGHAAAHDAGANVTLGTDGWPADLWEEARFAHFRMRERLAGQGTFDVCSLLTNSQRFVSSVFGIPVGSLEPGAVADLSIWEYSAPTPLDAGNAVWHALFGLRPSMIDRVMAGGRWLLIDGEPTGCDARLAAARTRRSAARLWANMARGSR